MHTYTYIFRINKLGHLEVFSISITIIVICRIYDVYNYVLWYLNKSILQKNSSELNVLFYLSEYW